MNTFTCFYCGEDLDISLHTIDHVVPKSQRGTNVTGNLVDSCRSCNCRKGSRSLDVFREWTQKHNTPEAYLFWALDNVSDSTHYLQPEARKLLAQLQGICARKMYDEPFLFPGERD